MRAELKSLEQEFGTGFGSALSVLEEKVDPTKLAQTKPFEGSPVRLIAFYLPQFHPIPENDQWWGKGFTEWRNVVHAKPQFAGHYQPHLPGELGFYDLRLFDVQKRQVELARLYGLYGFCFYFYWFNGTRLLETPVHQYLTNNELDLPFCLCWANENWSRRWDGRENELLITQCHSPKDDLAFIEYVSNYFKDRRYIRIERRPLLIVYRPDLLPSPKETVKRWRDWSIKNGIGELFLAYTQSFESVDPRQYGFDAAIEFPPNMSSAPIINITINKINPAFRGLVYDWRAFQKRSRRYSTPRYRLFRGVCPGWDNEARRTGLGTVYFHSSPEGYEEWLFNAGNDMLERETEPEQRLVFVNAWNEWAEGAHLEPDERYGYSYLAATRRALHALRERWRRRQIDPSLTMAEDQKHKGTTLSQSARESDTDHVIAVKRAGAAWPTAASTERAVKVLVHAFYPDLLPEILDFLSQWDYAFRLWVTTPHHESKRISRVLASTRLKACKESTIVGCVNRGRDILPFLTVANKLQLDENDIILKLHTKKTLHRADGKLWRQELYKNLLERTIADRILQAFESDPDLGVVAAAGHLVSLEHHWGGNKEAVEALCNRIALMYPRGRGERFPGGSMFFARYWAVAPMIDAQLSAHDFPAEEGQRDGTTAHAVERLVGIVCHAVGGKLRDSGELHVTHSTDRPKPYRFADSDRLARRMHDFDR